MTGTITDIGTENVGTKKEELRHKIIHNLESCINKFVSIGITGSVEYNVMFEDFTLFKNFEGLLLGNVYDVDNDFVIDLDSVIDVVDMSDEFEVNMMIDMKGVSLQVSCELQGIDRLNLLIILVYLLHI